MSLEFITQYKGIGFSMNKKKKNCDRKTVMHSKKVAEELLTRLCRDINYFEFYTSV